MKLEKIEYPYSELYTRGYIYPDKTGRKMVMLAGPGKKKLTTAYARYLMCVKLGHLLDPDITVDHIDNDHTNDNLENLQLLSRSDNVKKSPLPRKTEHGTYAQYKRGCRCDLCVAYSRERQRRFRVNSADKVKASKERSKHTGSIDKICETCGSPFKVHNWEKRRRFCCKSCASIAQHKNQLLDKAQ